MNRPNSYSPAEIAPTAGTYELVTAAGATTPFRVPVLEGAAFPPAPPGWAWRLSAKNLPPD